MALFVALALALTLPLTQGLGLSLGLATRSVDIFFSTPWAGRPADKHLVWGASTRGGGSLAWGLSCKAAACSQGSRPTGRASSMREYNGTAVLSVCPRPVSALRVAGRGPLVPSLGAGLLKSVVSRHPPTPTASSRLFHSRFFCSTPFPLSKDQQSLPTSSGLNKAIGIVQSTAVF